LILCPLPCYPSVCFCFAGYATPNFEAACEQYIRREDATTFTCLLCGKINQTNTNAKNHLEAIHLASTTLYTCIWCTKLCKTKHALDCHISKVHRRARKN
jgi:hypothetical protein